MWGTIIAPVKIRRIISCKGYQLALQEGGRRQSVAVVLDGALEHKDNLGTGSVIRAGDVQRIPAGTGIRHSEYNASKTEPVHFLQLWIVPQAKGLAPGYEQQTFTQDGKRGRLRLVGSNDGRDGSVTIQRDVDMFAALLAPGDSLTHTVRPGRAAWVHVAAGSVVLNDQHLEAGDGAAMETAGKLTLEGAGEVLVLDMAM